MIWLINANTNQCRIYDYQKKPAQITLIKELSNPAARLKASVDLTSDKPGHYQGMGSVRGAYSPHTDPKENEIDHFARDVARELDHGRNTNLYKEIILIAPPHMIGLLNLHTDKHVKELVIDSIHNDLIYMKDHELLDFIKNHGK
jgi:protein required for attachment to host cells